MSAGGHTYMEAAGVRSAAAKMVSTGEEMATSAAALARGLDAEGNCWGGDEAGQKFGTDYAPAADGVRKVMAEVAKTLQDIGKNLEESANLMEQQDQFNARGISG
ncbi:WXG100 family type VII secretion target [Lentzea sp. NPDC051208]|uniref:WXG100 family type VII secretion target n=1 Tax=Lentzea sp. NPDC051208 TaxID=3154642 RepID=UPI003437EB9B